MLQDYFNQLKRADRTSSALFDAETVVKQSKLFAFHPVVQELRGYVLDDENTSNHHLLITVEPLAGSVFFFRTMTIREWFLKVRSMTSNRSTGQLVLCKLTKRRTEWADQKIEE